MGQMRQGLLFSWFVFETIRKVHGRRRQGGVAIVALRRWDGKVIEKWITTNEDARRYVIERRGV